ncbi:MAG: hypothetical protein J0H12_02830 [Candidatus Paracaedimonas acanthamoebae]|uniref:Putative Flp pilus-assembly TadG-like N-terminal domain-containing protein n=1 Tax=Candidatus Paracaedimonas acanthamoebae TaxID=244581 RepID=A0A8J7Q0E3_9PROT|nr:hypothetical protein [Candidatus Paracaedimonas acanthamoebae]
MIRELKKYIREIKRNEDGAVYIMFAFLLVPFIIFAAIAIEVSRASYINTQLAYAADAAALAGARYNVSDVQSNASKIFYANFINGTQDVNVTPQISVSSDQKFVTVSVSGSMPTILGKFADVLSLQVHAFSKVQRSFEGFEMALVLDVTGSMASNGKMTGLKTAATNLITTIYGMDNTKENMAISIVPYVAAVNIGTQYTAWLSDPATVNTFPKKVPWEGCVKAVDTGSVMDKDDAPSSTRKWPVYYTESTYGKYGSSKGDNDWVANSNGTVTVKTSIGSVKIGPNRSCGPAIMPLTNNRDALKAKIATFEPVYGGGTFGNLGLVWGWNTISPKWSGLWNGISPQAYDKITKYVLIMTDGENNWYDESGYQPVGDPTAYGRLQDNLLGTTTISQTRTKIDNRLIDLCTKIKAAGIQIFTVTFQVSDSQAKTIYKQCASKAEWAFQAENSTQLNTFFSQIGETVKKIIVVE